METMNEAIARVEGILSELGMSFEKHDPNEDGVIRYQMTIDDTEKIIIDGLLYDTEDGSFFRLISYVDELKEDDSLAQLKLLMLLNLDIPTGAFCMDDEDGAVLVTVNVPVQEMKPELLGWVVEFLLVAQQVYFDEFYGASEETEGEA